MSKVKKNKKKILRPMLTGDDWQKQELLKVETKYKKIQETEKRKLEREEKKKEKENKIKEEKKARILVAKEKKEIDKEIERLKAKKKDLQPPKRSIIKIEKNETTSSQT